MRELRCAVFLLIAIMMLIPGTGMSATYDSLTVEVVRMLNEGLSSELVSEWLEKTGKRPESLGADDLIVLKQAGASESLVQELVYLAGLEEAPKPVAAAATTVEEEEPSGPAPVQFTLRYDVAKNFSSDASWHLFVYLDGDFLFWSPGVDKVVDLATELEPGHHTVRFLLERHVIVKPKKMLWEHEAKVCLASLELEIRSGSQWKIDVTAGNEVKGVAWKVLRDGEVVDEATGKGGPFAQWPKLCEEILSNIPEHKWDRPKTREATAGCADWGSLWPSTPDLQTRKAIRKKLADQQYRPVF